MGRFSLVSIILDLLYPPRCVFCRKLLNQNERGLCEACQSKLPWLTGKTAEQKPEFISLCVSPLLYQAEVRDSIHRFKFSGCSGYANTYGRFIAQCVGDHLADRYDLITWVPLSSHSKKVRKTNAQSSLKDDSARRANVMGAYEVRDPDLISGKRILLIDDVVTTGSTMSECARMLRTYGAADVVCATLARARSSGK